MYSLSNSLEVLEKNSTGKFCTKCGLWKELGGFYSQKGGKFGKAGICKECDNKRCRERNKRTKNSRRIEGIKVCANCGVEKSVDEFGMRSELLDGLFSWCKECVSKRSSIRNNPRKLEGICVCTGCGSEKSVYNFPSDRRSKSGLYHLCKECCAQSVENLKKRSVLKTEGFKVCCRCGIEKDINCFGKVASSLDGRSGYCLDCMCDLQEGYYLKNKEAIVKRVSERNARKRREDPNYKAIVRLRSRIYAALHGKHKIGSAVKDLGCSVDFLLKYLENQFYPHPETGEFMTWDNWGLGRYKWNLDHITELHTLNLEDKSQFLQAVHYTNLQPLWTIDNLRKSFRIRRLRRGAKKEKK